MSVIITAFIYVCTYVGLYLASVYLVMWFMTLYHITNEKVLRLQLHFLCLGKVWRTGGLLLPVPRTLVSRVCFLVCGRKQGRVRGG